MLLSQGHHTGESAGCCRVREELRGRREEGLRAREESSGGRRVARSAVESQRGVERRAEMAAARAGTVLAFNVVAAPMEGLVPTALEQQLHAWFQGERSRRFVLFDPCGAALSTLAVKFVSSQAERGGGGLRLVFVMSASSMEPDYTGLLGQCALERFSSLAHGAWRPRDRRARALTHTRALCRHGAGGKRKHGEQGRGAVFRAGARGASRVAAVSRVERQVAGGDTPLLKAWLLSSSFLSFPPFSSMTFTRAPE